MGDIEITDDFRKKLIEDLDHLQFAFVKMSELYHDCLNNYVDMLQRSIANSDPYLNQNDLIKLHQTTKRGALLKVYIFSTMYDSIHCFPTFSFQKEQNIWTIKWHSVFNGKLKMKSMESFPPLNVPMNQNEMNLT